MVGAVRASIGPATTREDITRLVDLVRVAFSASAKATAGEPADKS
jgi:selenocysteine lyase/cysteine desulfurase